MRARRVASRCSIPCAWSSNYPADATEELVAPNHPQRPDLGRRALPFARELLIERDDYREDAPKGYFRLAPGAEVRLRYGYIVRCIGAEKDAAGNVTVVHCTYDPATRSGTAGADRSIPLEKALSSTLLAYEMNSEARPLKHGYTLRALALGWTGANCVKWLHQISGVTPAL